MHYLYQHMLPLTERSAQLARYPFRHAYLGVAAVKVWATYFVLTQHGLKTRGLKEQFSEPLECPEFVGERPMTGEAGFRSPLSLGGFRTSHREALSESRDLTLRFNRRGCLSVRVISLDLLLAMLLTRWGEHQEEAAFWYASFLMDLGGGSDLDPHKVDLHLREALRYDYTTYSAISQDFKILLCERLFLRPRASLEAPLGLRSWVRVAVTGRGSRGSGMNAGLGDESILIGQHVTAVERARQALSVETRSMVSSVLKLLRRAGPDPKPASLQISLQSEIETDVLVTGNLRDQYAMGIAHIKCISRKGTKCVIARGCCKSRALDGRCLVDPPVNIRPIAVIRQSENNQNIPCPR